MIHKISLHLAAGAALLLLAPLTTSHAQYARGGSRLGAFSGGGAGRAGAINSASGARGYTGAAFRNNRGYYGGRGGGYYGGRGGYYGGRNRYFHRGSYYYYDPFFFGGFGYPSYYYGGGYGSGFGVGYYGAPGYYGGYGDDGYYGDGGDRVYNGRIASEVNGGRRRGGDDSRDGDERGGRYSPNSMARAVQGELKERGYYRGTVDGQFGAGTASALRAFQRDKGLKVTGRLDERTLKALNFDER